MGKIRAFISKKSVPRGIDINNKEYWQPFAIFIKGSNGGSGENDGNNTCNITIITVPEDATIVAVDSNGNSYNNKSFSVNKGASVNIVANPSQSSTGYKQTIKTITSEETNQDELTFTITLDNEEQGEQTSVTIVCNDGDVHTTFYDSNNNKLNENGENIIRNVVIGSILRIECIKNNYTLVSSSSGVVFKNDDLYPGMATVSNVVVSKDMIIYLNYLKLDNAPAELDLPNYEYVASANADPNYTREFNADFYKIRIYGDLPIIFDDGFYDSVEDSLGGHSITDVNELNAGKRVITFKLNIPENTTNEIKRFNFNVVAENKSGEQVFGTFVVAQAFAGQESCVVSINTKINNVSSNSTDIIRKINGTVVANEQELDILIGSTVTFEATYLGTTIQDGPYIITENKISEINFETVNIGLGTVTDENGNSFNTWQLTLSVPSLNLVKENWKGEQVTVIKESIYTVTGIDTSGQRPNYNSGIKYARGPVLNVVFGSIPTSQVLIETIPSNANVSIKLKVAGVQYDNGSTFPIGTRVGYVIIPNDNLYEIESLSDGSPNAIVVGTTQMPVVVTLREKVQYVNVTINTKLNNQHATDANVYINNELKGTGSPFIIENLENGKAYTLKVSLNDENKILGFVASPNKVVDVDFGTTTNTKYELAITMLNPSDALIEVDDYTNGENYTQIGELYQQIEKNHEITIKISKEGYVPKLYPANANEGGRIIMDNNKNYLNVELDEIPPIIRVTYTLNVVPNDAKVEFSEDESNYQEYPSHQFVTWIGRTVYWRVTKEGYIGQTGNSGSLQGDKTDSVTLQQEAPNVNNNVLFVINSIKDKDTNANLNDVVINLKLKGINQQPNKTINQSDIQEVVNDSSLNQYIGKYGGVSSKGTNVEIVISKEGYDNYENSIPIPVDYNNKSYVVDLVLEETKYIVTFNPITNISGTPIIPDDIVVSDNGNYTNVSRVGNMYRYNAKKNSNISYIVRKEGYGSVIGTVFVDSDKNIPIVMGHVSVTEQFDIVPKVIHINKNSQIVSFDTNCPEGWVINFNNEFSQDPTDLIKQVIFNDKNIIAFDVKENTTNQTRERQINVVFINNSTNERVYNTIKIIQYSEESFIVATIGNSVYTENDIINITVPPLGGTYDIEIQSSENWIVE